MLFLLSIKFKELSKWGTRSVPEKFSKTSDWGKKTCTGIWSWKSTHFLIGWIRFVIIRFYFKNNVHKKQRWRLELLRLIDWKNMIWKELLVTFLMMYLEMSVSGASRGCRGEIVDDVTAEAAGIVGDDVVVFFTIRSIEEHKRG